MIQRRRSVLISLATMLLATCALTASAWADGKLIDVSTGAEVTKGTKVPLSGNVKFETLGTGIECTTVNSEIEYESSSTGKVISFAPVTSTCAGFGSITQAAK